jgi:hypothetical protein
MGGTVNVGAMQRAATSFALATNGTGLLVTMIVNRQQTHKHEASLAHIGVHAVAEGEVLHPVTQLQY